jgi:hypothetical protein
MTDKIIEIKNTTGTTRQQEQLNYRACQLNVTPPREFVLEALWTGSNNFKLIFIVSFCVDSKGKEKNL